MSDLAYRISPSLQCLLLASSFDQNSFREPRAQLGDIVSEGAFNQRASVSSHRRGPKTVPAQTAEITKCHVIFVVFFKI